MDLNKAESKPQAQTKAGIIDQKMSGLEQDFVLLRNLIYDVSDHSNKTPNISKGEISEVPNTSLEFVLNDLPDRITKFSERLTESVNELESLLIG